ncbi:hypothetical protein Tco_1201264 [Tanacetum coccineum]
MNGLRAHGAVASGVGQSDVALHNLLAAAPLPSPVELCQSIRQQTYVNPFTSRTNEHQIEEGVCFLPLQMRRLVPSCCVILDLEPLSLSFDLVFSSEIFKSFPCLTSSSLPSCVLVS